MESGSPSRSAIFVFCLLHQAAHLRMNLHVKMRKEGEGGRESKRSGMKRPETGKRHHFLPPTRRTRSSEHYIRGMESESEKFYNDWRDATYLIDLDVLSAA